MKAALRRILVTTDLSELSRKAFSYGVAMAEEFAAEMRVVYVMEPSARSRDAQAGAVTKSPEAERACAWEELENWVEERRAEWVIPKLVLREGKAAAEIVAVAKEERADVIVISAHGRGRSHSGLGSTAEAVVRQATCHVLVVRDREKDLWGEGLRDSPSE